METVTSVQNPKIKTLLQLQEKSRARRSNGLFIVEGRREISHCLEGNYKIDSVFICPEIFAGPSGGKDIEQELGFLLSSDTKPKIFLVTRNVYEKIAYRGSTEGIIAEVVVKEMTLSSLEKELSSSKRQSSPLVIVLESVEKPGNLGAVLRSADAAGADAVIVCDALTDIFNPNLIRSSIGAAFTVPIITCTSNDAINWLKDNNFTILTAQLQDSELYYDCDMTGATAIVMGTESTGLSDIWRKAANAHIRIPMLGKLDSLNVSVSAAILLFEAIRQRH